MLHSRRSRRPTAGGVTGGASAAFPGKPRRRRQPAGNSIPTKNKHALRPVRVPKHQERRLDSLQYSESRRHGNKGHGLEQAGFQAAPVQTQESGARSGGKPPKHSANDGQALESPVHRRLDFEPVPEGGEAGKGTRRSIIACDSSQAVTHVDSTGQPLKRASGPHGKVHSLPLVTELDAWEVAHSARVPGAAEQKALEEATAGAGVTLAVHDPHLQAAQHHLRAIRSRVAQHVGTRFKSVQAFKRRMPGGVGGHISLQHFLDTARALQLPVTEQEASLLFHALDRNADGQLHVKHITGLVKPRQAVSLPARDAASAASPGRGEARDRSVGSDGAGGTADDPPGATDAFDTFTTQQVPLLRHLVGRMYSPRGGARTRPGGAAEPLPASLEAGIQRACRETVAALHADALPDGRLQFQRPLREEHAVEAGAVGEPAGGGVVRLRDPVLGTRATNMAQEQAIVKRRLRERVAQNKPRVFRSFLKTFDPHQRGYYTQDQFLALVAHDSGLNMPLQPREARLLVQSVVDPATGTVPRSNLLQFMSDQGVESGSSFGDALVSHQERAKEAWAAQAESAQASVQAAQQRLHTLRASHAEAGTSVTDESAQDTQRWGGWKPGSRAEAFNQDAWAEGGGALGTVAHAARPQIRAGAVHDALLASGCLQPEHAVVAGSPARRGTPAPRLDTPIQRDARGGEGGTMQPPQRAPSPPVVVVRPTLASNTKGWAASQDAPRSVATLGHVGGAVEGPAPTVAQGLGLRDTDAGSLSRTLAQTMSVTGLSQGGASGLSVTRASAWGAASAATLPPATPVGGPGLSASASASSLGRATCTSQHMTPIRTRARRGARPSTSPSSGTGPLIGAWGSSRLVSSRPSTAAAGPGVLLRGTGPGSSKQFMFQPNVDAATPARVAAWRRQQGAQADAKGEATRASPRLVQARFASPSPVRGILGTTTVLSDSAAGQRASQWKRATASALPSSATGKPLSAHGSTSTTVVGPGTASKARRAAFDAGQVDVLHPDPGSGMTPGVAGAFWRRSAGAATTSQPAAAEVERAPAHGIRKAPPPKYHRALEGGLPPSARSVEVAAEVAAAQRTLSQTRRAAQRSRLFG